MSSIVLKVMLGVNPGDSFILHVMCLPGHNCRYILREEFQIHTAEIYKAPTELRLFIFKP